MGRKDWFKRNHAHFRYQIIRRRKTKLALARALIIEPEMLFLDEPTAGVDIDIRTSVWNYIKRISKQGKTICLTTHYLVRS